MIADNGLSVVTVKKSELLNSLRANRQSHEETFKEATEGYRAAFLTEAKAIVAAAKSGDFTKKAIRLEEPVSELRSYDRVIRMLEMCIKDEVAVSEQEFRQYVMDDWSWKIHFTSTASNYIGGKR